jgi:predicted Fe-Mo cluster-binding NifX family protein
VKDVVSGVCGTRAKEFIKHQGIQLNMAPDTKVADVSQHGVNVFTEAFQATPITRT